MQLAITKSGRIRTAWTAYVIVLAVVVDLYLFLASGWSLTRAIFSSMFFLTPVVGLAALAVAVVFLPGRPWTLLAQWAALLVALLVVGLLAGPWFSVRHTSTLAEHACTWASRQPDLGTNIRVGVVFSNLWVNREDLLVEGERRSALIKVNLFALGEEVVPLYPSNADIERDRSKVVTWVPCNDRKRS